MRRQIKALLAATVTLVLAAGSAEAAVSCPYCNASAQTLNEELATMDLAVIAKLVKAPQQSDRPGDDLQKFTFEITQIIKGEGLAKEKEKIESLYFGDGKIGDSFLLM